MADYYKTLGLERTASNDDIKRSYRKLALKYHPDRNKGDATAEAKFKEISEAYAVLSDTDKRKQYDTFGDQNFHQRYSSEDIFRGTDFSSIFSEFDLGGGGVDHLFSRIFGGGFGGQSGPFSSQGFQPQGFRQGFDGGKGQDVEYRLKIGFHEAYAGGERQVAFRLGDGTSQDFKVKIPAGVKEGGRLRIQGKGAPSPVGGSPGDLFVIIEIGAHPDFAREDQDVIVRLPLKVSEAFLGATKEVVTPQGEKRVKVPKGVKPGTRIRLKGLGFPQVGGGTPGDLYAVVELEIPQELSGDQLQAIEALAALDL